MSYLQDAAVGSRCVDKLGCGFQIRGDRLFDQHVDSGAHQVAADFGMQGGGDRYYGRLHAAGEVAVIGKGRAALGGFGCAGGVGVDYRYQLGARRLADYAHVVAAKLSGAYYRYAGLGQVASRDFIVAGILRFRI